MFGHGFESHKIKALKSSAVAVLCLLSVCVLKALHVCLCSSVNLFEPDCPGCCFSLPVSCLCQRPCGLCAWVCVCALASLCQVWVRTCPLCCAWLGNRSVWSTCVCAPVIPRWSKASCMCEMRRIITSGCTLSTIISSTVTFLLSFPLSPLLFPCLSRERARCRGKVRSGPFGLWNAPHNSWLKRVRVCMGETRLLLDLLSSRRDPASCPEV